MGSEPERIKVLFLCTGNACRSQMAEGWARRLKADRLDAFSGGVAPQGVDPRAVRVMSEAGVDISGYTSKHVDTLEDVVFEYVVTLCDRAQRGCPVFPAKTRLLHVGFDDPPVLAADSRNEEEALGHYRRVRDEIRRFVESLPEALLEAGGEEKEHG